MIDVISCIVDYYTTAPEAQGLRTLLADNGQGKLTADFDPANVPRPYVVVVQPHNDNSYEGMGRAARVDKTIIQFLCFADTRAAAVAILDQLETVFRGDVVGLAGGIVVDRVAQLDPDKIDAWKATANFVFWAQQDQS